jgi:hypothetical protein
LNVSFLAHNLLPYTTPDRSCKGESPPAGKGAPCAPPAEVS